MKYTWLFFIPPIVIAVIIFIAWYRYRMHSHDRDLRRVAVIAHTKTIKMLPAYRKAILRYRILLACAAISFLASLFSLTAAAARPTQRQERNTTSENRDVVLCLDVSGSMDLYQGELIKYFNRIVSSLHGQRISVTIFDSKPVNLIPLTDDYDALIETLDTLSKNFNDYKHSSIQAASSSTNSSAIGDGVMGCINSLDLSEENLRAKSLIISTDNNYGPQSVDIGQAARYAERYGITFYGIYVPYSEAKRISQYENATKITNGNFYDMRLYYTSNGTDIISKDDADKTIESIIREIMAQETAKMEGAPEVIYTDQPNIALYISGACFALFMIAIWRLKL